MLKVRYAMNCEKCDGYGCRDLTMMGLPVSLCPACAREWNEIARPLDGEFNAQMREKFKMWLAEKKPTKS